MGICMSKDKKGATATAASTSVKSKHSSSSQGHDQSSLALNISSASSSVAPNSISLAPSSSDQPTTCSSTDICSSLSVSSSSQEEKEPTSTDKHVVQIRLPLASPNKFTPSPASVAIAAQAIASIAHPEDDLSSTFKQRDSSPPIFYNYLSRASFSRDLAAFSRDLNSLSSSLSCSPLKRSPSTNATNERHRIFARTSSIKTTMSPLRAALRGADSKLHPDDSYSTTTRSRSLPKRFYSREPELDSVLHKRSLSRDIAIDSFLGGRRPASSRRHLLSVDPSYDIGLSPRLSVRREEASGEYRMYSRHSAARKNHGNHNQKLHAVVAAGRDSRQRKKERSPLRSSTGKVADADQLLYASGEYRDEQHCPKVSHTESNMTRGRLALMDKSLNCLSGWDDTLAHEVPNKPNKFTPLEEVESCRSSIEKKLLPDDMLCDIDPAVYQDPCYSKGQSFFSSNSSVPENMHAYPSPMDKAQSILEAMAELNMETSFSEIEESEAETDHGFDLLQFVCNAEMSPKKEFQAQRARKLLLKEAAMDAFGRPSNSTYEEISEESVKRQGLAALMTTFKLDDADADTLKIRKVLRLLSAAECELGREQKAAMYKQLRILLDSVQTPMKNESEKGVVMEMVEERKEKVVTSRANSWPRTVKEPPQTAAPSTLIGLDAFAHLPSQMMKAMTDRDLGKDEKTLKNSKEGAENQDDVVDNVNMEIDLQDSKSMCKEDVHEVDDQASRQPNLNEHQTDQESTTTQQPESHMMEPKQEAQQFEFDGVVDLGGSESRSFDTSDQHSSQDTKAHDFREIPACYLAQVLIEEPSQKENEAPSLEEGCTQLEQVVTEDAVEGEPSNSNMDCKSGTGANGASDDDGHFYQQSPFCEKGLNAEEGMDTFLNSSAKQYRPSDVGSEGSFEFRARSATSTPLSTPSTPLISTASTPRQLSRFNSALTAQEMAEIWDAFG